MNPLFRSPIDEEKVQNILDLGTGDGAWVCGYRYYPLALSSLC